MLTTGGCGSGGRESHSLVSGSVVRREFFQNPKSDVVPSACALGFGVTRLPLSSDVTIRVGSSRAGILILLLCSG